MEASDNVSATIQDPIELQGVAASIQKLLESGMAPEALTRLTRLRSRDQADVVSQLSGESRSELLGRLEPDTAGALVEELDRAAAIEICRDLKPESLARILDQASPDAAADVLRGLPEAFASLTIERMTEADGVTRLLDYEDDDAGGLMTPEFIALRDSMTVTQALAFMRRGATDLDPQDVLYLFVVGRNGMLAGVVNLAQLVMGKPSQRISLLMDPDVISVPAETDQERCASLMRRYGLGNLPVVDGDGRLVGVLHLENMIGVIDDEATEDMYRMFGVAEEEKAFGPFWRSVRGRLPWLCINLGTAILAGLVITLFESTLARALALAAFLPVIAGQGGIAGTQTLTVIVRSMALGDIGSGNARHLLSKEVRIGLVHGLALGVLVGLVAWLWQGNAYLALVVGLAMAINLVIAAAAGALVPLGFRALRVDPALSSSVAVTTATDVFGFLVFLGLAALVIESIA